MRAEDLAVNGRRDCPMALDDPAPALSWRVRGGWQTAYQVRAAVDERRLHEGPWLWDSGKVPGERRTWVDYGGQPLESRQRVVWQVRLWDADDRAHVWSEPAWWEMGLLRAEDWGRARWIEHPRRSAGDPLPVFASTFVVSGDIRCARLYLAGLGVHEATINGCAVTDEVLAPGNSNYQRSVEYRTHDVTGLLTEGDNTLAVRLGHGTAFVHREGTNPRVGRHSVYAWWTSSDPGVTTLRRSAEAGANSVSVECADAFEAGQTVHLGAEPESRWITRVSGTEVAFEPPLERAHASGAPVTGSGNPVADLEPSAGTAVTPRLIARLEIVDADGRGREVVSGPHWRTALGAAVTDHWYSGTDYDARREQVGWDEPGGDLSATALRRDGTHTGWIDARVTASPNLATRLVCRAAEPVRVVAERAPVSVREPAPGVFVFDFGQNCAGWPELWLDPVPRGTTIVLRPAESLRPDGTVDQTSIRDARRGRDVGHSYTAWGSPYGECWRPSFQYFAMRFVEVTGFPDGYRPTVETLRCLRLRADLRPSGGIESSDGMVNRIDLMVYHSIVGNMLSVLTDCPGREKLSYGADYTHLMSVLTRHFDFAAYLRTMQRHLVEGQSKRGNVALKAPVYDWGYAERFGDEINWGNAIILVPWLLYENYGDMRTMTECYPRMRTFLDYITTCKAGVGERAHIVTGPLGDWVASEETSGDITGTWAYYLSCRYLAEMASVLGEHEDSVSYHALADEIAAAFHGRFFFPELGCYSGDGTEAGATQAAQGLALDAGLVPDGERGRVVDALVERIRSYRPHGGGPHFSAGHIGLGPVVRALSRADRDDVLWEVLQQDTPPGYGYFLRSTAENPGGLTTIPEQWDLRNSLNHMILTQIDEWFHAGLAGIRQARGSVAYQRLIIKPKPVGDLDRVDGWYEAPAGRISTSWRRSSGRFELEVKIPSNTVAEIWVPGEVDYAPHGMKPDQVGPEHTIYRTESGEFTFRSSLN